MREIKFRAWRDGEMLYQQQEGHAYVAALFNRIYGQHLVMQFTGLKDKNGKEIWEGDIIQIEECECTGHDDNDDEIWESCEGEISFEDGMFVFSGHSAGTLPLTAYIERIEVIGNIHQNPELL